MSMIGLDSPDVRLLSRTVLFNSFADERDRTKTGDAKLLPQVGR